MVSRCVAILGFLLLLAGCGRLGYGGQVHSTDMNVVATSSEIRIEAPDAFVLVFDEAHAWQASSWTDLTTDEGAELSGGVLQVPFVAQYGGAWYEIDSVDFTQRAIYELDADHVMFRVIYGWIAPDESEIEAWATYDIWRDGTWTVEASLENKNDVDKQFGVVYAQTNLQASADWMETQMGSSVSLDAANGAHFVFSPEAGSPGTLESDAVGGFEVNAGLVDLGAWDTIDVVWTNRLLP